MIASGNKDTFVIAMNPHEARALYYELMNVQVHGHMIMQQIFTELKKTYDKH